MSIKLDARNADLADIKAVLEDQRARQKDVVAPSSAVTARNGMIEVAGVDAVSLTDEGVETVTGRFRPTATCDEGLGERFGIPPAWLKQLRAERTDLYDATLNGMIGGSAATGGMAPDGTPYPPHDGTHLLRLLQGDPGEPGVARAVLSSKYRIIDNLDVLIAVLTGVRATGLEVHVGACDLSDRRMYVRLEAPGVAMLAPKFLEGYRSPFDGQHGASRAGERGTLARQTGAWEQASQAAITALTRRTGTAPQVGDIVWAGLIISNSDVGNGALYLAPQVRVLACRNGQTVTKDAKRRVHLGAAHEVGEIEWSHTTQRRELELITSQATDAVTAWLSQPYLEGAVNDIERLAGVPVLRPDRTVKEVAKAAGFGKAQAEDILGFFVAGGQGTAGGVANAVTAYAQTVDSAEVAFDLESRALSMMEHAARIGH